MSLNCAARLVPLGTLLIRNPNQESLQCSGPAAEPAWRICSLRRHLGIFQRSCYRNIVAKALFLRCGAMAYQPNKRGERMNETNPIVMSELTDPVELAKLRAQNERADRNSAWLQAHVPEIYSNYRGKCICVAGEELFVADTVAEVMALAKAAHSRRRWSDSSVHPQGEKGDNLCYFRGTGFSVTMAFYVPSFAARWWRSMVLCLKSNFWRTLEPIVRYYAPLF